MRNCFFVHVAHGSTDWSSKTVGAFANGFSTDDTSLDVCWKKRKETIRYQLADRNAWPFIWTLSSRLCRYVDYLLAGSRIKRKYWTRQACYKYFQYGMCSQTNLSPSRWDYRLLKVKLGGSWLYKLGLILTNHTEVMRRFLSKAFAQEGIWFCLMELAHGFCPPFVGERIILQARHGVSFGAWIWKWPSQTIWVLLICVQVCQNTSATSSRQRIFKESWSRHLPNKNAKGIPILKPVGHQKNWRNHKEIDLPLVWSQLPVWIQKTSIWPFSSGSSTETTPSPSALIFMERWRRSGQLATCFRLADFIHLRGHADLKQIYPCKPYLTTSQWETFGLGPWWRRLEQGWLLGFDTRYGNPAFIKRGENGFLVPYSETVPEQLVKLAGQLDSSLKVTLHHFIRLLMIGFLLPRISCPETRNS